jgi:hypothetical protein
LRLGNDTWGIDAGVRATEGGDDAVAATFGGTEVDKKDLIPVVVDDAAEFDAKVDQVRGRKLTFEDGVLEVVAKTSHDFEDLAEAFVVGDVVGDEVGGAHGEGLELFKQKRRRRARSEWT